MKSAFLGLLFLTSAPLAVAADNGPVAYYNFDNGSGTTLRDEGGHYNGTLRQARWIKNGRGFALSFDGKQGEATLPDVPALDFKEAVTVEAWVKPAVVPTYGEPVILGKGYGSFVLTYYSDGNCYWYINGGGQSVKTPLAPGAWYHIVGTFDGTNVRLYVDGQLAAGRKIPATKINSGGQFHFALGNTDSSYSQGAYFNGAIDEVKLYNRALSATEIARQFLTTNQTGSVAINAVAYPYSGEVTADLDWRGLGHTPASIELSLRRAGSAKPLKTQKLTLHGGIRTSARLSGLSLSPGTYTVHAVARAADQRILGSPGTTTVVAPARPAVAGTHNLNNLVTQLLDTPVKNAKSRFVFTNPRRGWVYIAAQGRFPSGATILATLLPSGRKIELRPYGSGREAMCALPAGRHVLQVTPNKSLHLQRVVVRAIPELVYCQYPAVPNVAPSGPYDWDFLARDVLPNVNCIISGGEKGITAQVQSWKRMGRKWIAATPVPGLTDETITTEAVYQQWSQNVGYQNPLYDGIIADEFAGGNQKQYDAWTAAVDRLQANPAWKHKTFYPWCAPMYGGEKSRRFIRKVMDAGSLFAFERYLPEEWKDEAAAGRSLETKLSFPVRDWEKAQPGAVRHMIMTLGYMSAPNETLNVNPGIDYRYFMEMQFRLLANDPVFAGLGGLMEYKSSYADEETVRWAGKLFRHYAIEGRTDMLSKRYGFTYHLRHLQNADLADGLRGWKVEPAESGSMARRNLPGLAMLQGHYPVQRVQSDNLVWMQRQASRPNRLSQTVKNLVPGRLYSLKFFTADYSDLQQGNSRNEKHAVAVTLSNATRIPAKSFVFQIPNNYAHHYGEFNAKHLAWFNYHQVVFRARAATANLTIADWATSTKPGGEIGRQLAFNFFELQPYLPD